MITVFVFELLNVDTNHWLALSTLCNSSVRPWLFHVIEGSIVRVP